VNALTAKLRLPFAPWRSERSGGSQIRGLPELVERVREICRFEGLTEGEAAELVASPGADLSKTRIERALGQIFAGECPDDVAATTALAHELEERFGEPLRAEDLAGLWMRIGSRLARAFGVVLGVSCLYLVLGGLLEGESERFPALPGPGSLLFFVAALAFLGLFEALHTSVTQLRLADLRGLGESHPRALALHRRFRDDVGISRVLAGRQIVVVITVFLVAGLSSFPHMTTFPFTDVAVPGLLEPVLKLGIPGALVVLWIAQLAPQFYATRHPVALMDTRAAGWALDLAFALESIGVSDPSHWFTKTDDSEERIPTSPALHWERAAEDVDGDGLVSIVRRWDCDHAGARLQAASTTSVRQAGHPVVADSNLTLPGVPSSLSISADIFGSGGSPKRLAPTEYHEEDLPTGDRCLHKAVAPAVGGFAVGDRARVTVDAEYVSEIRRDVVHIVRPARFLMWRLVLSEQPARMAAARLCVYRVGDGLADLAAMGEEVRLEPTGKEGDLPVISYALAFPPPNTIFVFEWEVLWR
jgi:hypothetical protein